VCCLVPVGEKKYIRKLKNLAHLYLWGSVDGVKLTLKVPTDFDMQLKYYNGWLHKHCICNVILFDVNGMIRWATVNMEGTAHDSKVSHFGGMYNMLMQNGEFRYNIVGDSAFPNIPGLIRICKKIRHTYLGKLLSGFRQSAEWGMQIFQKYNKRLTVPLPWDGDQRLVILILAILLTNFRVTCGSGNQINTVFNTHIAPEAQAAFDKFFIIARKDCSEKVLQLMTDEELAVLGVVPEYRGEEQE